MNAVTGKTPPSMLADTFHRDGFIGPIKLLGQPQCRALSNYLFRTKDAFHPVWMKGRATIDRVVADIAMHPVMRRMLAPILGEDIILWGASGVRRGAGTPHPWHVDIESAKPGRFASLWIGLENVTPQSSLRVIAGSHRVSHSFQEFLASTGLKRSEVADEQALEWARDDVPDARLVEISSPRLRNATRASASICLSRHEGSNPRAWRERMAIRLSRRTAPAGYCRFGEGRSRCQPGRCTPQREVGESRQSRPSTHSRP